MINRAFGAGGRGAGDQPPADEFWASLQSRGENVDRFNRLFRDYDVLLTPTAQLLRPQGRGLERLLDGERPAIRAQQLRRRYTSHVMLFNWLSMPAFSVPARVSSTDCRWACRSSASPAPRSEDVHRSRGRSRRPSRTTSTRRPSSAAGREHECDGRGIRAHHRWLERDLGGRVVRIERQARWRPAWWVDLERDGELLELCVRGERLDSPSAFSLDHERIFQTLLSERGIRVARVHGHRDANPKAYVMDRVPGRDNFEGVSEPTRRSAMEDYVDILLEMHQLDVTPFADAGIVRAATPQQSHLVGLRPLRRAGLPVGEEAPRSVPGVRARAGWTATSRTTRAARPPIVWDAGQFHQQDGRITAMLDLEFGHIGDPLADLAGAVGAQPVHPVRRRRRADAPLPGSAAAFPSTWPPYAGITSCGRCRTSSSSTPCWPTRSRVRLHAESALVHRDQPDGAGSDRHQAGVEFGDRRAERGDRVGLRPGSRHLERSLERLPAEDPVARYELRKSVRLARHVERIGRDRRSGRRRRPRRHRRADRSSTPDTWAEGEAELERFVLADDGAHDEATRRSAPSSPAPGPNAQRPRRVLDHPTSRRSAAASLTLWFS